MEFWICSSYNLVIKLIFNIFWRSRLVWSRARDWKSRNRQKRFKSSNLFFSATQKQSCQSVGLLFSYARFCLQNYVHMRKADMRSITGLQSMSGDLRSKEMFFAPQRLTSSSPPENHLKVVFVIKKRFACKICTPTLRVRTLVQD